MGASRAMLAGAAAGAAAWAWFASRPAIPVLIGLRETRWCAPAHYQASAFPAFGAEVARGVDDWRKRGDTRRLLLAAICAALGLARLRGALPWSGHAFFLGAVLAFETRAAPRCTPAMGYALGGVAVTLPYKALWRDVGGAATALALGSALGLTLGLARRRRRRVAAPLS